MENKEYYAQHNQEVDNQDVNIYCATNRFMELKCLRPHNKPHGILGLGNNRHMRFDPKLGHGTYATHRIPCDCNLCTYTLDKLWITGLTEQQQPRYQTIKYFKNWPMLGSFNNLNVLKLSYKATSSEEIDKNNQVVLDDICYNMASLVQTSQYGAINTTDTATMRYYVNKFMS